MSDEASLRRAGCLLTALWMLRQTRMASPRMVLAVLFMLPIAGIYRPIANWLPSALTSAPDALVSGTHHLSHYLPALAVAVAVSVAALAVAVLRLRAREI